MPSLVPPLPDIEVGDPVVSELRLVGADRSQFPKHLRASYNAACNVEIHPDAFRHWPYDLGLRQCRIISRDVFKTVVEPDGSPPLGPPCRHSLYVRQICTIRDAQ